MITVRRRAGLLLIVGALMGIGLAACASSSTTTTSIVTAIPGDAQRGAALFTQSVAGSPTCIGCHTLDGAHYVGPSLQGMAVIAGTRIKGLSAADYLSQSITQPSAYIVNGYGNTMYSQYANHLSALQIADLVAYLLTL